MIESAVVSMWVLETTQRIGPARTAWYSARVVSIRAMHSSLPHSQNTIITGTSALVRNPLISSAMRSLTSRRRPRLRSSRSGASAVRQAGSRALEAWSLAQILRYRADRTASSRPVRVLSLRLRARVCLARNFLSVLPRASRRRRSSDAARSRFRSPAVHAAGRPRNGSRVRESPRTRAMVISIVSEHSVRPHSQVKSTALSVSVTT